MKKYKAVYAKQYQKQDGSNGTSWKQLGFANEITNQEGKTTIHLSLDSIPTGAWGGEIKLFLQDENQGQPQNNYNQAPQQQTYQQPAQQGQHSNTGSNAPIHHENIPQNQYNNQQG